MLGYRFHRNLNGSASPKNLPILCFERAMPMSAQLWEGGGDGCQVGVQLLVF